jgi:DNA-binding HxlR family transcriptional regulator
MTEIDLKILTVLQEDTYIKRSEIEHSIPIPQRTLTFNLKQLIDYKRVETIGQLKGTKYK